MKYIFASMLGITLAISTLVRGDLTPVDSMLVETEVSSLQDSYFDETGKYLQVLKGNRLPTYESGSVEEKLGQPIDNSVEVNVYEGPLGKGYSMVYDTGTEIKSVGFGPQSADFTYSLVKKVPPISATSTDEKN